MATLVSRILDLALAVRDKLNQHTVLVAPTMVDKGNVATGTVTFNRSTSTYQRLQVGGALTVAVSNWPATGVAGDLVLEIVNGGAAAITWPAGWIWKQTDGTWGAGPPRSLQTAGTDLIALVTRDGGTTVRAIL